MSPEQSRAGASDGERRRRSAPPRAQRRARRVHRVLHRVDIWSLTKVAAIYALCAYVVLLVAGVLLWRGADQLGTIEGIEGFMEDQGGYDRYVLDGGVVFQSAFFIGLLVSVLVVILVALGGVLFNLISDLTGGIRVTMIDEDLLVTAPGTDRRPPVRREAAPDVAVGAGAATAWSEDVDPDEYATDGDYADEYPDDEVLAASADLDDADDDWPRQDWTDAAHASDHAVGTEATEVVPSPVTPVPATSTPHPATADHDRAQDGAPDASPVTASATWPAAPSTSTYIPPRIEIRDTPAHSWDRAAEDRDESADRADGDRTESEPAAVDVPVSPPHDADPVDDSTPGEPATPTPVATARWWETSSSPWDEAPPPGTTPEPSHSNWGDEPATADSKPATTPATRRVWGDDDVDATSDAEAAPVAWSAGASPNGDHGDGEDSSAAGLDSDDSSDLDDSVDDGDTAADERDAEPGDDRPDQPRPTFDWS